MRFDVQRASYTKPVTLTQVIHRPGGGTTTRSLPSSLLDGFNGLRDFLRLSVADAAGQVVASSRPLFCLNFGPQRAGPGSAAITPQYVRLLHITAADATARVKLTVVQQRGSSGAAAPSTGPARGPVQSRCRPGQSPRSLRTELTEIPGRAEPDAASLRLGEVKGDTALRKAGPVVRQAEREEFAGFVGESQARMVRLALLLSGDRGRAEDLAQEGYAKAYASWGRIRDGDPGAYVRRCIINANTDWWRRRTWREQPRSLVPDQPGHRDLAGDIAARDVVLRALARLTRRERAVLALRFYADLTEFQIAYELGIAPGTVKSASARGLAKLRADTELQAEATS